MGESRRKRQRPRRATEWATVSSPLTPGTVDRVRRVVDPVEQMYRAGQIDGAMYAAAQRYRRAYEAAHGGGGGFDPSSRGRYGGTPRSGPPSPAKLAAGLTLNEADRALARKGGTRIVELIAGRGETIEAAAEELFGTDPATGRPRKADRDHCGAWFRLSLRTLAELWGARGARA